MRFLAKSDGDVVEKCENIFVKAGFEIHNGPTRPTTVFQSSANRRTEEMNIRSLAKFTCRCCAASVEADAGRCSQCGIAYPTSELRAVALSPTAIPFYAVAVLGLITFWFWQ